MENTEEETSCSNNKRDSQKEQVSPCINELAYLKTSRERKLSSYKWYCKIESFQEVKTRFRQLNLAEFAEEGPDKDD